MAGSFDFQSEIDQFLGRNRRRRSPLGSGIDLDFRSPEPPTDLLQFQDAQIDPSSLTAPYAAALTAEGLPGAKPDEAGGFSATKALFDALDIGGAVVRGLAGAGISLGKGDLDEAGKRALSALPGGGTAPTGSDLLHDLGFERGTTLEDERRVRIAQAAGLSDVEARARFGKQGDKRLDSTTQKEFDDLLKVALERNPALDAGASFSDWKKAVDAQDAAGLALEIALDPLTYMTFGASAAGKAAKAINLSGKFAPKILDGLKGVKSASEAAGVIRGIEGMAARQKDRLAGLVEKAWDKGGRDFALGRTLAEQAEKGQSGINFMGRNIGGRTMAEVGTLVGQTDLARDIVGTPGVREGVRQTLEDGFLKYPTRAARAVVQSLRKTFDTGSGVGAIDDIVQTGRASGRILDQKAERELNRLSGDIRDLASRTGIKEADVRTTVAQAVETVKARADDPAGKLAADYAATLSRTGLTEAQVAPIAAGLAKLNAEVLPRLREAGVKLNELTDESLSYLHRQITPEGRDWARRNNKKLSGLSGGMEFDARTGTARGRIEKWRGKTIAEINKLMEAELGAGKKFFYDDPIYATRTALRENHRALGNANVVTGIVEKFGQEVPEGTKGVYKSALDLYKKAGIHYDGDEAAQLAKVAIDDDLFDFVARAVEFQEQPGKFVAAWQKALAWMKATVTLPFAAFHGRNLLENGFKAVVEGNTNPANYKAAAQFLSAALDVNKGGSTKVDEAARMAASGFKTAFGAVDNETKALLKEAGVGESVEDAAAWMAANGVLENKVSNELGAILETGVAANTQKEIAALFKAPLKGGFAVSSGTENWHRVSMFLDRLRKGYSKEEALGEVKRIFFDYRNLTNMEGKYARYLGFFYNFYRNNLRYIVGKLGDNPQLSKQSLGLFKQDPDNPRSRWLSQKAAFKVAGMDISLGFIPQQQFNMFDLAEGDVFDKAADLAKGAGGQLNPAIVAAIEAATGTDLYTNTPLEWRDRAGDWSFLPPEMQKELGLQQTKSGDWRIDPKWNFYLSAIPALGRVLQTAVVLDDPDRSAIEKATQLLSGVRVQANEELEKGSLDLLTRNINREAERLNKNERLLRQSGNGAWVVDTNTARGRLLGALSSPGPNEFQYLTPQIMLEVAPLVSVRDGKVVMNRLLRDKLDEIMLREFPQHAALLAAVKMRRASASNLQEALPGDVDAQTAMEAFLNQR